MDNFSREKKTRTTRAQEALYFKRFHEEKMAKQGKNNRAKQRESSRVLMDSSDSSFFNIDDDDSEEEVVRKSAQKGKSGAVVESSDDDDDDDFVVLEDDDDDEQVKVESTKEEVKRKFGSSSSMQRKSLEKGKNVATHDDEDDDIIEVGEEEDESEEDDESEDEDRIYTTDESADDEEDSDTDDDSNSDEEDTDHDEEEEEEGEEKEGGGRKKKAQSVEDVKSKKQKRGELIILDDTDQEDKQEGFSSEDDEDNDYDHSFVDSDRYEVGKNKKKRLDACLKRRHRGKCSKSASGQGGGRDRDAYKRSEAKGITEEPAFRSSSSKSGFAGEKKRVREEVERKKGSKRRFESRKNRIKVDSEDESIDQQTKEEKLFPIKGKGCISENARSNKKSECNEMRVSYGVENILKFFVNTIWETSGDHDNTDSVLPAQCIEPLIRKFNYGVEKHAPVEKSDEENYVDMLWEDFDIALSMCDGGSSVASKPAVEVEDVDEPNVDMNPSYHCSQGKHDFVLDDQVGIKCRYCSFVHLEIRYVMPPVDPYSCGRSSKKRYTAGDNSLMWETSHEHDAGGDSQDLFAHGKGSVWGIFSNIRENMYPHQVEGFEFLWRNIAGGIELNNLNTNDIGGCIISHAPGTGKSFLTIAFIRSYMQVYKNCRPIIMAPASMLSTWEEEFEKWRIDIPFHNLGSKDLSGKEEEWACKMIQGTSKKKDWTRMIKLLSWSKKMSILGISYDLFGQLAGERSTEVNGKGGKIKLSKEAEEIKRILLEKTSLLVLDEGHIPRNKDSCIWKALLNVKTGRRIILSGTPFQNNFEELYNTLYLVRPKFAECGKEVWDSLTRSIGKNENKEKLDEIKALINPFVHSYKGSILKEKLPGLRGCVMVLNPLPLQTDLLEIVNEENVKLTREHAVAVVSVHPNLLMSCKFSGHEKYSAYTVAAKDSRLDPDQGVKTMFLIELIRLCEVLKEKVLVFSEYIMPFNLIKDQLKQLFGWTEGDEILQLSGKLTLKDRQPIINAFNDPCNKARVLLASIGTCREGINLIGASRVVLLDTVWNPSVERQAISRAYRLGQTKVVYTYHLLTSGTLEEDKYDSQVRKDQLGELVFSCSQSDDANAKDQPAICSDRVLEAMVGSSKFQDSFKEIRVLAERAIHPFESVLRQSPN